MKSPETRATGRIGRGIKDVLRLFLPDPNRDFDRLPLGGGTEYDGLDGNDPAMIALVGRELDRIANDPNTSPDLVKYIKYGSQGIARPPEALIIVTEPDKN